jgi:hypothetical protein
MEADDARAHIFCRGPSYASTTSPTHCQQYTHSLPWSIRRSEVSDLSVNLRVAVLMCVDIITKIRGTNTGTLLEVGK